MRKIEYQENPEAPDKKKQKKKKKRAKRKAEMEKTKNIIDEKRVMKAC